MKLTIIEEDLNGYAVGKTSDGALYGTTGYIHEGGPDSADSRTWKPIESYVIKNYADGETELEINSF